MILRVLNLILIVITFGLVEIIDTVTYDEIDNNITVTGYEDYTYREVFDGNNLISDGIFTGIVDITHSYYNASEDGTSLIDNTVKTAGKNLFDGELETNRIDDATGENLVADTWLRSVNSAPINSSGSYFYTVAGDNTADINVRRAYYYDSNNNYISTEFLHSISSALTIPINTNYIRFSFRFATVANVIPADYTIMLEQDTTATTYEEYKPLYLALI